MLTLKRASKSRPSGAWSDDDVIDGEQHIGRIMLHPPAPEGEPWFWTITAGLPQYPHGCGCAATLTQAMADTANAAISSKSDQEFSTSV